MLFHIFWPILKAFHNIPSSSGYRALPHFTSQHPGFVSLSPPISSSITPLLSFISPQSLPFLLVLMKILSFIPLLPAVRLPLFFLTSLFVIKTLTVNWANYCTVCHTWVGGGGTKTHTGEHTHTVVVTIRAQILIMNHLWLFTAAENNPRHLQATTNLHSYSLTYTCTQPFYCCHAASSTTVSRCFQAPAAVDRKRICPSAGGGIQAGGSSQPQHQRLHVWCHVAE